MGELGRYTVKNFDELLAALIHTVEYVGLETLPPLEGWSWFDALSKFAPEVAQEMASRPVKGMAAETENNLVRHARQELELLGEEPATIEMYLNVVRAFAEFGHSGGSASVAIPVIHDLLSFRNLTPLTDNPDEWIRHTPDRWDGENHIWQSRRRSEAFSTDGGKTYYLLSERKKPQFEDRYIYTIHTSKPHKKDQ